MSTLAKDSYESGQHNASFLSNFLLGNMEQCVNILVETDRIPEAAFLAHTYCPSQVSRLVHLWQEKASKALSGIGKRVSRFYFYKRGLNSNTVYYRKLYLSIKKE